MDCSPSIDAEATNALINDIVKVDDYFSNPSKLEDICLVGNIKNKGDAKYAICPAMIDFKQQSFIDYEEFGTAESTADVPLAIAFALIKSGYIDKASEEERDKAAAFMAKFLDVAAAEQKAPYVPCAYSIEQLIEFYPELHKITAVLLKQNEKKIANPEFEKDVKYPINFAGFLTKSLGFANATYDEQKVHDRHPRLEAEKQLIKAIADWKVDRSQNDSDVPPPALLNSYVTHMTNIFKCQDINCRLFIDSPLVKSFTDSNREDLEYNFVHLLSSAALGTLSPLEKPKQVIEKHVVLLRNAAAPQLLELRSNIFVELFRHVVSSGKLSEKADLLAGRNGYFWSGRSGDPNKLIQKDMHFSGMGFKYKINCLQMSVTQGHPMIVKEICAIISSSKEDWEEGIAKKTSGMVRQFNLLELACLEQALEFRARHYPGRDIDQDAADIVGVIFTLPHHVKELKEEFAQGKVKESFQRFGSNYPKLHGILTANGVL